MDFLYVGFSKVHQFSAFTRDTNVYYKFSVFHPQLQVL